MRLSSKLRAPLNLPARHRLETLLQHLGMRAMLAGFPSASVCSQRLKLRHKCRIRAVEFCIDLLEVFCRLAVHLGLTLGVGVACRQRDERNDEQRETKYVLFHFVFCIESAVTGRKKLCTLPERLLRLTMS